jgi:hypothetical protein
MSATEKEMTMDQQSMQKAPRSAEVSEAGALAYWFDIAPAVVDEWLDWYLHDHLPSRVGTTFVSGRCYEAIEAASSHMVLFETTTPEALLAESYLALLKQVSPEDKQRRGWYSNTIRVTCRVRARNGSGTGSVLGVIRIAGANAKRGDIEQCLLRDVVPALAGTPRIGAVWLLENDASIRQRMDAARVTGHQDGSADWAVLIEAGHEGDVKLATARLNDLASWRALQLGDAAVLGQYRLLYTMTKTGAT